MVVRGQTKEEKRRSRKEYEEWIARNTVDKMMEMKTKE